MLDYRLETFLSVCDTMNYRKSAELLHITQPAITQHIQHLEHIYGCKLFRYENRRLKKTHCAVLLEQYARSMKVNEENLMRQMKNTTIRNLRLGATKTIGECLIRGYVEQFIRCQDNELTLMVDNTKNLLELLDNSKLDFALIEGTFDKTRYGYHLFRKEPFVGICAPSHPFAGRSISISELLTETLICREEGSGTRAILENNLLQFNESIFHFQRTICISCFSIILDFVEKGIGISFVYEVLAKHRNLSTFTLENGKSQREFNIVYLKNTGAEEKIQRFLQG